MGRVKGTNIKRLAKTLFEKYPAQFGTAFTANKKMLHTMGLKMQSKIEFNKLVGEITNCVKKAKAKEKEEITETTTA